MTKEEILKALGDAGINTTLTEAGEIRAELLELALAGVNAKSAQAESAKAEKAYVKTIDTLNERIEELEKQKTPAEKAGLIKHEKSGKIYRLKHASRYQGVKLTAEILNENQKMLTDLIKTGSTILEEEKEA